MSSFFYRLAEKLRGENIIRKIEELEKSQYQSSEELQNYQRKKLWELLEGSKKNVPYFREIIKETDPDRFSLVPILTREKIRENWKGMFHPQIPKRKFIRYSSSGTTGEPLILYLDRSTVGYYHAAQWRGFSWHGVKFGAKGIKIWGVPQSLRARVIEKLKDRITNRLRFSAFDMEKVKVKEIWEKMLKFKPSYLYGYASALYLFAQLLEENNLEGKEMGLKLVVSTAEVLYDFQREKLKKIFGCPLANEYGACEAGIIAFECPQGSLHLAAENVYLEVIDDNNLPRKVGEEGRILVTSLRNFSFPLLRYELGDVGVLTDRVCSCGIKLPLLESIVGRTSDFVVTEEGKRIHSEFFSYLNRELSSRGHVLKEFKIIQKAKNLLILNLLDDLNLNKEEVENFFSSMIKKHVSPLMGIRFEYVERIDSEKSGKKRYFVNEISS